MAEQDPRRTSATTEQLAESQAALWLTESLILALINAGVVDKDRMLEAVDVVITAKRMLAAEGRDPEREAASVRLLSSISASVAAASGGPARPVNAPRRRTARRRTESA